MGSEWYPRCPNACEGAITCRTETDTVYYKDKDPETDWSWKDYAVSVDVPVFWCERCDQGWTDWRSEDIRAAAIIAHQLARKIDYDVLQEIKIKDSVDK